MTNCRCTESIELNQQHVDFSGSATTRLKSKLFGRPNSADGFIPSQPSSILYSPVFIRLYTYKKEKKKKSHYFYDSPEKLRCQSRKKNDQTSCVTILNTSSTLTPVRADVSTKNSPFCSANAFASSRLTSRRAP